MPVIEVREADGSSVLVISSPTSLQYRFHQRRPQDSAIGDAQYVANGMEFCGHANHRGCTMDLLDLLEDRCSRGRRDLRYEEGLQSWKIHIEGLARKIGHWMQWLESIEPEVVRVMADAHRGPWVRNQNDFLQERLRRWPRRGRLAP